MLRRVLAGLAATLLFITLAPVFTFADAPVLPSLVISEVKVRNDSSGYDEYIEIYNKSPATVLLSDYSIEYFNSTNPLPDQSPTLSVVIDNNLLPSTSYFVLARKPEQILHSKQLPFSSLSDSGGRLRLVDSAGVVTEEVAWTSTQSQAVNSIVYISSSVSNSSKSITRQMDEFSLPVTPISWILTSPSPLSSVLIEVSVEEGDPEPEPEEEPEEEPEPEPPPAITCEGVIINEVLPNPAGADGDKEFIELYNPTDEVILLDGCSLRTTANSKVYALGGNTMEPGQLKAFYNSQTELTLPNSAGGTVWLLSSSEELQSIEYPGELDDDVSWALFGGQWLGTYTATPGGKNIHQPTKPCPVGQERNLETGRCRTIRTDDSGPEPCSKGYERNPLTNRCRLINALDSNLTPCAVGQERNPETNRCRKIGASSNQLVPCKPGQERNPETNRCRKSGTVAGTKIDTVEDVESISQPAPPNVWVAGAAVTWAAGYGAFEWRRELLNWLAKLKAKF